MGEICLSKNEEGVETCQQKCSCVNKVAMMSVGRLTLDAAENLLGNGGGQARDRGEPSLGPVLPGSEP